MQTGDRVRETASRQLNNGPAQPRPVKGTGTQPPAPPKRGAARLRTIIVIAALFCLALIGLAVGKFMNTASKIGGGKSALSVIESIRNPRGQFPNRDRINLLLIGTDYDYVWGTRDKKLNGARTSRNTRSDTIAMVSLDLKSGRVSMLSVPRDTLVTAPETVGSSHMVEGKINGTYRRGGYPLLKQAVTNLLGVAPDHYIAVKPDALKNIVDALGGVEVETIDNLHYNDWAARLFVDLPKGKQTINGGESIGFARFREPDVYVRNPDHSPIPLPGSHTEFVKRPKSEIVHSLEEGEPRRMARQQQLIRAMTHKAQSFQNLLKLDDLVNVGLGQVDTDLDRMQIFALVSLFRSIKSEQMESATLKGHGALHNLYFFYPDEEKKRLMVEWLLKGDERAANQLTVVQVQNGTDTVGAATRVAEKLREKGFDVRGTGNADRGEGGHEVDKTRILYHAAAVLERAEGIAKTIGGGALTKEPKPDTTGADGYNDTPVDITVVVGRDVATQAAKEGMPL